MGCRGSAEGRENEGEGAGERGLWVDFLGECCLAVSWAAASDTPGIPGQGPMEGMCGGVGGGCF